jgi:hypothetical protein
MLSGVLWPGVVLLLVIGCSSAATDSKPGRSQRERDSTLGASQLPGAHGVRGALRASDSAAARNSRLDSVASQP